MKNNLKKLLCAALSTAMIAGSIVLPMTASADDTTGGNYAVTLDGNTATIHSSSNAYAMVHCKNLIISRCLTEVK